MTNDALKEIAVMIKESAERNDKINQRLTKIIIVMSICFTAAVIAIVGLKDGFYFLSDYQYPTQSTQEVKQDNGKQEVKQEIR